mgnify:CR=1 FL=1
MTNLRDVRLAHGKTTNEVARKIGVVPRVLQEYEDDNRPIPPGDIECLNYYFWGTYYPREGGIYYVNQQ